MLVFWGVSLGEGLGTIYRKHPHKFSVSGHVVKLSLHDLGGETSNMPGSLFPPLRENFPATRHS